MSLICGTELVRRPAWRMQCWCLLRDSAPLSCKSGDSLQCIHPSAGCQGSINLLLLVHVRYISETCNCRPQQAKSQEGEDRKPADAQEVKLCLAHALVLGSLQMQDATP